MVTLDKQKQSTVPNVRTRLIGNRRRRQIQKVGILAILLIGSAFYILPFLWMLSTSLKPSEEVFTYPPRWIPTSFEWRNYVDGWTILPFTTFLMNSLIITITNVIGNLVSCSLAAYGFARLQARGRNILFVFMLGTMMIPLEVTLVPTFLLFNEAGLLNTFWPLIIPAWFGYPFAIFLLRQFFMTIPRDLDDAARIDGASHLRILITIIIPLSKPALATVSIFAFIGNWNNLIGPLIYLRSTEKFTMALGLRLFDGQYQTFYNQLMAVSIISLIPMFILFFVAQRLLIQGVALTGMGGR